MGCGLIGQDGEKREYARNSGNSQPSMKNSYATNMSYYTRTNNEYDARSY